MRKTLYTVLLKQYIALNLQNNYVSLYEHDLL